MRGMKFSSRQLTLAFCFAFMGGTYAWSRWTDKNLHPSEGNQILLGFAPIGAAFVWLIMVFALNNVPGFLPKIEPGQDRWETHDKFLKKPSTKLKMVFVPITLPYYGIKAIIKRIRQT